MENLLQLAINTALIAGNKINEIYRSKKINVEYKPDQSPITQADVFANKIITEQLSISNLPLISEESIPPPYKVRKTWEKYWMIDPIDGTKEFINKTDDFTVNIALIENNYPVIGVIYLPIFDTLYYATAKQGAYKLEKASNILTNNFKYMTNSHLLPLQFSTNYYTVLISRSHEDEVTTQYIDQLKLEHNNLKIISRGSSLKFGLLAEGSANIYPRLFPLNEWDIAAGVAIASISGAKVYHAKSKEKLSFNSVNLRSDPFIIEWA